MSVYVITHKKFNMIPQENYKNDWLALTAAMYTETVLTMPVTIFQRKMQTIVS